MHSADALCTYTVESMGAVRVLVQSGNDKMQISGIICGSMVCINLRNPAYTLAQGDTTSDTAWMPTAACIWHLQLYMKQF